MKTCWQCNNIRVKKVEDGHTIKCSHGKLNVHHRSRDDSMDSLETIYKNKLYVTHSHCDKFDDED